VAVGLIAGGPVAYGCQTAALQAQVQSLQAQVRHLKEQLHAQTTTVTPAPPLVAPPSQRVVWSNEWRQVRHQMTESQVLSLLGKPPQVFQIGSGPVWYYHYAGIGNGSVAFDNNQRVLAWQRPPFGR